MFYSTLVTGLVAGLSILSTSSAAPSSSLQKRTTRTTAPTSCLTVSSSGADYTTLAAALTALGSSTDAACIFMYSGTYAEQVTINYGGNLTIYGYTTDTSSYKSNVVTISHGIDSTDAGSLDESSTANIVSDNFEAYNINFENTFGSGAQAVAVTANGDKQSFYGCSFISYQDTLYAKSGMQYYSNCYIEGAVDYIFGKAAAWFGECTIASSGGGSITANSREETDDTTWFVIDSSTITSTSGTSLAGKVYLGRPWRVLARVIYQNSKLSDVIAAAGWTTMADSAIPIYEEYGNTGDGADTSSRLYETTTAAAVNKNTLFGSTWKSWIDTSY